MCMRWTRFSILIACAALVACTTTRDITHLREVRESGLVAKTYALRAAAWEGDADETGLGTVSFDPPGERTDAPLTPGTLIRVVGVKRINIPVFVGRFPVIEVEILNGVRRGERRSMHVGFVSNEHDVPAAGHPQRLGPSQTLPSMTSKELIALLTSPEWNVRFAAADALRVQPPDSLDIAREIILLCLQEDDPDVRIALIESIKPEHATGMIPELIAMVRQSGRQSTAGERLAIDDLVVAAGPAIIEPVHVVIAGLLPDQRRIFSRLLRILARLGGEARPTIATVVEARKRLGPTPGFTEMIIKVDARTAVEFIERDLGDSEWQVRRNALELLKSLGPAASPALSKIRDLAENDPLRTNRIVATEVAESIAPRPGPP
jgi:HEAT repeat protein